MDRRADIVVKTGQSQFRRAGPTSNLIMGLDHVDRGTLLREVNGGGETIRTGPDDEGVVGFTHESTMAPAKEKVVSGDQIPGDDSMNF